MEELKTGEVGELFRSGWLSSLRSLAIDKCNKLKSISGRGVWDQFTALESLSLRSLVELELEDEDDVINNKSTEEGCINNNNEGSDAEMPWRYLAPTLRSLVLDSLPKVVKLPRGIGCLSSLQSLHIWSCENLETMPEEMRHLTSLTKLHIRGCSTELINECREKNGANWSNIQHIPNIVSISHGLKGFRAGKEKRTFLCTEDRYFSLKPFVEGVSKVKYLRVLRLNHCYGLEELPSRIGELVHLRYLDLSDSMGLCVLPSSITKLFNLQTLDLCGCSYLKSFLTCPLFAPLKLTNAIF
ncbi:disease resistance protein RGA2-like [Chenopodium quinoa]|uniref:disease resistance protein RGA2-like n=1 Tax=Chenopodium quinoa TaxID=63459 RepID=UPI000B7926AA|nr:disease resistance protein RGA2-like [Chenopodium quinoa]